MNGTQTAGGGIVKLVEYYRHAASSMQGMPIYNPALVVELVGLREHDGRQVAAIVTPWFMNLTVLPSAADRDAWRLGATARVGFPSGLYDFVVSEAGDAGLIATCSLFSPMHDFTDQASATQAAAAAVEALFEPESPATPPGPRPAPTFSRRKLFGG